MKHRILLAAAVSTAALLISTTSLADTFTVTSGNPSWNVNSNWDTNVFPNSTGATAILSAPTGDLTIDLGEPITVGSLTVNKSTTANLNTTIGVGSSNTLTFDGGTSTLMNGFSSTFTGQAIVAAPIVFGPTMPSSTFTATQGGAGTLALNGSISGTGNLTVSRDSNGSGAVVLGAANSYSGNTTFLNGQTNQNFLLVRLNDANSIPGGIADTGGTSNLTLSGSVVIGLGATDFTRGLGAGADKFQFTGQGNSGWAAFGQDRAVKVTSGVGNPDQLVWGSSGINTLTLSHNLADKTIDLQNTVVLTTGTGTVGRTIRIVNGSAAVDAKISGPIINTQGTANVTFTGANAGDGTVSLTAANTWNGTTTFNSGVTVRLENAAALPSGNLLLSANGIVGLGVGNDSFSRALGTAAGQIQITTGGGFAAFGGNKTVNLGGAGATVTWGAGNFVQSGSSLTLGDTNSDATLDFVNGIDLSTAGNDRTILAPDGSAAVDGKVSGVITGGGNLRKNNPGTLEISNANTYTGTTLINAGTLLLTNATSIPGGIAGANTSGIIFTGTAENPVPTLGLGQGDLTSELSAAPGAGQIGVTTGTGAGFAAYGATRIVNFKTVAGSVTQQIVWGTGGFPTGVLGLSATGADATLDLQNPIDLNAGARRVKVANGTANIDGMLSGVINGAGGSLEKDGGGTLKLTAANTYDGGTTISQGRLNVSNTTGSGTGSGPVNVNAGTLGGTGSIAGLVTVASGAHIAPGESIESLDVGSLTLNIGSILDFELGAPGSPGLTSDLINVSATNGLTVSGGIVNLTDVGGLASGTYTLIDYAGTLGGGVGNMTLGTQPVGFGFALVNNPGNTSIDLQVTSLGVPGDYNNNGSVDAADYVLWRAGGPLQNEVDNPGTVNQQDYTEWAARFGNPGAGAGLSDTAVPEPAALLLLCSVALLCSCPRRPRRRG
jgi:autotransporter-associated beta strand protein